MNKTFSVGKLSVKGLCVISLMTAITVILSVYCTFRIGSSIKIPFKFISVYLTAATMGPIYGGAVALLGDLLNVFLVPSGQWLVPISAIEFLNGFIFGLFFYNRPFCGRNYAFRVLLGVISLFTVDMLLTSFVLSAAGYFPSLYSGMIMRLPAGIVKALIQGVFLLISSGYTEKLKVMLEG